MTSISHKRRHTTALLALSLALPLLSAPAQAQSDKPLRMIVPNAAGSSVDALARTFGTPLSKAAGHPVVIENLPGAGGITGTVQLVRAPKDGLTLGMVSNNHVVNPRGDRADVPVGYGEVRESGEGIGRHDRLMSKDVGLHNPAKAGFFYWAGSGDFQNACVRYLTDIMLASR